MIPTQTQPLSRASFFPAPQRRRVKEKSAKAQSLEALRESRRKTSSIIPLFMDNKARGNYSPTTPPTQLYTQINPTESLDSRVARIKEEGTNIERLVSDFDIEARDPAVATTPSAESLLGAGAAVAGGLFLLGQFIPGVAEVLDAGVAAGVAAGDAAGVAAGDAAGDMLVATEEGGGAAYPFQGLGLDVDEIEVEESKPFSRLIEGPVQAAEDTGGMEGETTGGRYIEGPVEAPEDTGGMEGETTGGKYEERYENPESRLRKRSLPDDVDDSRPLKKSSQKNPRTRPPQRGFEQQRYPKRMRRPPLRFNP